MITSGVLLLLLTLALLGVSWLLVASEAAIGGLSKSGVAELADDHPRQAAKLDRFLAQPAKYANALLLAHTVVTLAAFIALTSALLDLLEWEVNWVFLLAVLVMGAVVYVILGVSARTFGTQRPYGLAGITSGLIRLTTAVANPFAVVLIQVGNAITPGKGSRRGPFASQAELRELVDSAGDEVIAEDERTMINSVFALGGTIAREVMVPRTEMVFIETSKTLRQCLSLFLRSGFSRIPVVREGPDDIAGVVILKDVVRRIFENKQAEQTETVAALTRPVVFVPDSKAADDLLREMQAAREHLAIVVDEFGGTAGLVTIEDILEEIVGEISDEFDTGAPEIERLPGGALRVSARLSLEHVAELTGMEVEPDAERVETVGGLLGLRLGRVPIPGSEIAEQGWTLKGLSGAGRRNQISAVLITPTDLEES
ncbi:MAG: hemolysin family protein [Actinomycetia bacterium]|nr:hemolysin family protein [Actinomycetes bacterium]